MCAAAAANVSHTAAFMLLLNQLHQIYPTKKRARGLGMAGAFSRIGGILMPWIGIYISQIGLFLPYLIFGITALAGGVLTFMLPFDTRGMELDKVD